MVLVGPWGLFWNSRVLERLNIRFLKPFFIISLSYWFSGRGHFAPRGNLVVFGSDSFGGEEEYITKGALGDKLEDQRFSPSTTDPPFLCIILCQLQVKTVWDLACGPHYAHPPSHPTLPIARVPSCSVKAFCFAAMLPSNLCICPSISLAASVKVTGILLELLPIGTSQKEVTVTRFLLTSVFKGLDPYPCFKHWRNMWLHMQLNSVVVGKFSMLMNFTLISLKFSNVFWPRIHDYRQVTFPQWNICFCRWFRFCVLGCVLCCRLVASLLPRSRSHKGPSRKVMACVIGLVGGVSAHCGACSQIPPLLWIHLGSHTCRLVRLE